MAWTDDVVRGSDADPNGSTQAWASSLILLEPLNDPAYERTEDVSE